MSLADRIYRKFNPECFQGVGKNKNYFEGWYFKVVNAAGTRAFAFIPGIAFDEKGQGHAFIQVLDGIQQTAQYIRFDSSSLMAAARSFEVQIEDNSFSETALELNLHDISGKLSFHNTIPWPKPWYAPGIMGPFSFVPFMQCYHGIVSMDHQLSGSLRYNNEIIDFEGGRGYIEKDWGRSFPSAYFWMQSNHFSEKGISLKASVANIPWMGTSFVGFIAGLWLKDKLIRFTTYNRTRLKTSFANKEHVKLVLENKQYQLKIHALRSGSTELASPIKGAMEGKIEESMTAVLEVELWDRKSKELVFQDKGKNAGLEVAGNIATIFK